MKIWKRAASVGLSLALCAGMVMPSFAATLTELNTAINDDKGTTESKQTYGSQKDITAYTDEKGVRQVTLNGNVDGSGRVTVSGKNVVLDMNEHTIDASGNAPRNLVFVVNKSADLSVKNGEISGNKTAGMNGGVFQVTGQSTLNLENVTLSDNTTKSGGAAIYAKDSTVNLKDVTMTGNKVEDGTGGVVYVIGSELNMETVKISDSHTTGNGGAIYAKESTVTMKDVTLTNNTADFIGGAIFVENSKMSMEDVEMTGNTAKRNGGAKIAFY